MEDVYLIDGRKARLISQSEGEYIVRPYLTYYPESEEDEEEYSEANGAIESVSKIFKRSPIEVIEEEYKIISDRVNKLNSEYEEKRKTLSTINQDIRKAENEKTNLERLIVNKSEIKNAKRIVFFEADAIEPFIFEPTSGNLKLSLYYDITLFGMEERVWGYTMSWERWDNGKRYDPKYGLMFDISDEEILRLTLERQESMTISDWQLSRCADKWLSPSLKERKDKIISDNRERSIISLKAEIHKKQEELSKLV